MFKHVLMSLSFSLLCGGMMTDAQAKTRGSFIIHNPTENTLYYQISRGQESPWKLWRLAPGMERAHHFPLDRNGRAAIPYIRFDFVADGDRVTYKNYELDFYEVFSIWDGKRYVFKYNRSGRYLDLYERS